MTVLQWLEQAKAEGHEWADAAIENTLNDKPFTGDNKCVSLSDALGGGFNWSESPQGIIYWSNIHDDIVSPNQPFTPGASPQTLKQ